MYPPEVQRKLEILDRAYDFPSDREAAKHLKIDRTTIIKYRRNLRLASQEELIAGLQGRRGRRPRRRIGRDPHALCRWIKSENVNWNADDVQRSMRGLGHRVSSAEVERFLAEPALSRKAKNVLLKDLDAGAEQLLLNTFRYRPIRTLAILNDFQIRMCNNLAAYRELIANFCGMENVVNVAEIERFEKECRASTKAIRDLISSLQGQGLSLSRECLAEDFVAALKGFPWPEAVMPSLERKPNRSPEGEQASAESVPLQDNRAERDRNGRDQEKARERTSGHDCTTRVPKQPDLRSTPCADSAGPGSTWSR